MESSKSTYWNEGEWLQATAEPGVSISEVAEEVPTLTVATIVCVTLLVLLVIAAVFVLGVLIDCRQQRVLDRKMDERKLKQQRRVRNNGSAPADTLSIAMHMEEPEQSTPPIDQLHHIP